VTFLIFYKNLFAQFNIGTLNYKYEVLEDFICLKGSLMNNSLRFPEPFSLSFLNNLTKYTRELYWSYESAISFK